MDFPPVPLWLVKSPACEHRAPPEHPELAAGVLPRRWEGAPQPTQDPPSRQPCTPGGQKTSRDVWTN